MVSPKAPVYVRDGPATDHGEVPLLLSIVKREHVKYVKTEFRCQVEPSVRKYKRATTPRLKRMHGSQWLTDTESLLKPAGHINHFRLFGFSKAFLHLLHRFLFFDLFLSFSGIGEYKSPPITHSGPSRALFPSTFLLLQTQTDRSVGRDGYGHGEELVCVVKGGGGDDNGATFRNRSSTALKSNTERGNLHFCILGVPSCRCCHLCRSFCFLLRKVMTTLLFSLIHVFFFGYFLFGFRLRLNNCLH